MRRIEIKLKPILDSRDINQKEFSRMTGIRPNTVSDYYHGHLKSVKLEHLEKIMDVLNLELTDIMIVKED